MVKRFVFALSLVAMSLAPLLAFQPPSTSQSEFVPIDQLPPTEQMPAAPFVIGAYALLWLIAMFYIWTIWNRMKKLEGDFQALQRRSHGTGR